MSEASLKISDDLELPHDVVTDTIGVLAIKGGGKTYAALVLVEEMVKAGLRVVMLDPVGVAWGLRSSADGKRPGLPVLILGGPHGDAPLEPRAGKTIADFVIEERAPCVLDLTGFETKAEHLLFAREFLERLYQKNREALHVMIDEADDLAPQRPMGEETRVLRAVEVLVRRGRARGLGCTLITQRAAVLNKNVLTQCSTLVLGRTVSPQDRAAIQSWVNAYGADEQKSAIESELAGMSRDDKWIWSPDRSIFKRVRIRERETFDSSATPKTGTVRAEPKALAEVDIAGLRSRIADTIERAKTDDPKELRRRIAELEKKLAAKPPAPNAESLVSFKLALSDGARAFRESFETGMRAFLYALKVPAPHSRELLTEADRDSRSAAAAAARPTPAVAIERPPVEVEKLAGGERKILAALAQHGACSTKKLAILTGYASSGGGFRNYLGALRTRGFIIGSGERIEIAQTGRAALGAFEALPTGHALVAWWSSQLDRAPRLVLEALARAYPDKLSVDGVAAQTGYEATGGGFRNALGKLRTLGLIEGKRDLRAADALCASGKGSRR